ncbi:phage tail tape measure protein [Clostridium botulinum]|uniref:phage tail protein n=1 Tax=Clostridium botulinum TaxID=1491 RepID=UPI000772D59A|nr:hypothetical protein [Clostridium botulinum]NFH81718.1 phage tail tape measure protein [Clostridium botulinum]NFH84971.1 phage tail tape measure protein [Clostridium botulinum]NFI12957.1 phage tail tape measure protein [Clostridium botulinum]NFI16155.1 phage tail tape measure protein [Clostridium botulinum]NFO85958.1 phage tail tape measure protein [Clostridium botulinum]
MADGSIIIDTKVDSSGAENGVKSLGKLGGMASNALGVATKAAAGMAVGIAAATGAVVALTKASIEQYAQYEQLVGGVETLFGAGGASLQEYAAQQGKTMDEVKDKYNELAKGQNTVFKNADQAYKTAGLSANEYMSTITGFSASLLQGLGGDTKKAADIGNQAVIDMADNANKMGTAMESIQNAYQGFAKQNYTMLDNLKLGYGGTKSEMERLLADAEKISGVHYDISKFSDVIQAIHEIQEQMGITGTTAKEAMSTIEGSLNMTKAAWKNMLTGMSIDDADFDVLIDNLVESLGALGENLMPRIGIALNGVGQLIDTLLPIVIEKIPGIIEATLPDMLDAGVKIVAELGNAIIQSLPIVIEYGTQLIQSLISGIQNNLPAITNSAIEIITSLFTGITDILPQLLGLGIQIIGQLAIGIGQALPNLIPVAAQCLTQLIQAIIENAPLILDAALALVQGLADGIINSIPVLTEALPQLIQGIIDFITNNLPQLLQSGQEIILQILNGMMQAMPQIIAMLPQIIDSIVQFITGNLPQIIDVGIQVILALIDGIINAYPQLIAMLPQIINAIVTGILGNLPQIIQAGIQIIVALAGGLLQAIPQLIGAIPQIVSSLFSAFTNVNWGEIGINIIKGIGSGITGAITGLVDVGIKACKSLKDSVCNFFDIHSPSRLMRDLVGKNIIAGISVGMQNELPNAIGVAKDICSKLNNTFKRELNKENAQGYIDTIYNWGGSFAVLAEEIQNAKDAVEIANAKTVDDNAWYSDAKYRLDDVKSKLEELAETISDTEDKSTKESLQKKEKALQKQQKIIQKEVDYYKEAVQEEIDVCKENAKQQLNIVNEKKDKLIQLSKAVTDALKERLEKEKTLELDKIAEEEKAEEEAYNKKIARIDKATNRKIENLKREQKALDEQKESENREEELQKSKDSINVLKTKMANTSSLSEKKAIALKIADEEKAVSKKQADWRREDEKARIQEEIDKAQEKANRRKERLKEDFEENKNHLEKKKKNVEEYYKTLLETDNLNAQARYVLLTNSNEQLVQLLNSYAPNWQNAGQSLADSLINGLNSKKQSMYDAVSELTSLRSRQVSGYATGTSYNPKSGVYTVDEKGFELSTNNNPVAYVSRGAGILNHMQSLNAIKKEVSKQMGTYAEKLRNAVKADQFRMGQLALARVGGYSNCNTTNNNDNSSVNFNVDKFINNTETDIEEIANKLGVYARRNKKC